MKRVVAVLFLVAVAAVYAVYAQQSPAPQPARAAVSPEQQARLAKQVEIEKTAPKLVMKEEVLPLVVPGHTIGEATGVAKNSKGHLFIFTRSGNVGPARGATASQLFEFDETLKYVKQWGEDNYAASFAHTVKVDKYDNVWMTDEGSGMIVKFNPEARVTMVLGRKPEGIDYMERFLEKGEKNEEVHPVGRPGVFNRPTDVTFDTQDNVFISDGYGNSRVAKTTKTGDWVKAVGTYGSGPNQFNIPHGITSDAKGNIYVADRGNWRIQVFDPDLNPLRVISGIRAPWSACITPGAKQYLYSGDGGGNIYKMDLEGNLLGWTESGQHHGQSGCLVHTLYCESDNVVYKGDCSTWNVYKMTFGSEAAAK